MKSRDETVPYSVKHFEIRSNLDKGLSQNGDRRNSTPSKRGREGTVDTISVQIEGKLDVSN